MIGSVKGTGYAPITAVDEKTGAITYGKVKWLNTKQSGTRELSLSPKGSLKEIWADGVVAYASMTNGGYEGTITTLDLCDDLDADWYGIELGSERIEKADNKEIPKFAMIVLRESTDEDVAINGGYTEIFPYCYVTSRPDHKRKTTDNGDFDYEFIEHKIRCSPSPVSKYVMVRSVGVEKIDYMPENAMAEGDSNSKLAQTTSLSAE